MAASLAANGETVKVESFRHFGPFPVKLPALIDSLDVNSKPLTPELLLGKEKSLALPDGPSAVVSPVSAPGDASSQSINYLVFNLGNTRHAEGKINVKGLKNFTTYADGKKTDGNRFSLDPATHQIAIKYLAAPEEADSLSVEIESDDVAALTIGLDGKRMFSLTDVTDGLFMGSGSSISPDGRFALVKHYTVQPGGKNVFNTYLRDMVTGTMTPAPGSSAAWMPSGSRLYFTRTGSNGRELVCVEASSGKETILGRNVPSGHITFTPDEKKLIVATTQKGPKEDEAVYQILEPEDRMPGWRDRSGLAIHDLATDITTPLTHGHRNVGLADIAPDSKRILFTVSHNRLTKRPTLLTSLYELNLDTYEMTPLVEEDGFILGASYSPDGTSVLVSGSPEALGGIGKNLPKGKIPNMEEGELFLISLSDGSRKPLTRDFDPSVGSVDWNRGDGMIYFTAENRDYVSLYRLDPTSGEIKEINVPEENITSFSVASDAPTAIFTGESVTNPGRLYSLDTETLSTTLLDAPRDARFADVAIGECHPWSFRNSRGDTIYGRYYLPADFDPEKKYPMIVNYYGGCSPTSRTFASRYPQSVYAALGYVVLVINPSGATGFGQEFGSRHVNTAGKGVAEDIIEGTKKFCKEHPYVNDKKIGCIGASYGGFMTQYLQTVTDIFAAAVSHAGISDHTSYWGNGYWGYSYSEVSMAGSYPWSDQELYVKQSPLYNAKKINTPLLLVHGAADTNVPVGESEQMFAALKLLGKEAALVEVEGENHWIMDYDKRIKWQNTIFAWFAKYLQDDPSWWEHLYPKKSL